jgi:hypothetical protein
VLSATFALTRFSEVAKKGSNITHLSDAPGADTC